MRLKSYFNALRNFPKRSEALVREIPSQNDGGTKHCIVVHGWAGEARAMRPWQSALRDLPAAASWRFWDVTYDTSHTPFPSSARQLIDLLENSGNDFSQTILVGYSMGGLVVRQMVADGFPCAQLVTLCSPHHGPVGWMPVPFRGARSLAKWSRFVRNLNSNRRDIQSRSRYHFFAVAYRDWFGAHAHDGMVRTRSALGEKLGEVATRRIIRLKYSVPISAIMPIDPHWRAMFPQYAKPALEHIGKLM